MFCYQILGLTGMKSLLMLNVFIKTSETYIIQYSLEKLTT